MSAFNDNILLIRGLTGLTQPVFARLIKSNESNVKTWETTEVGTKNFTVLQTLSELTGIPVTDLKNKQLDVKDISIKVEMVEKVKAEVEADTQDKSPSLVSEPEVAYIRYSHNTPDFLAGRLAEKDATIEQIEKRIQDALSFAKKMEQHYEDAKAEKAELFVALKETRQTINELLSPMATSLKDIPPVLDVIVRNSNEHDKEIMKALDHLVGNVPGTLEKESGKRILKGALERQKKGKADVGKQD